MAAGTSPIDLRPAFRYGGAMEPHVIHAVLVVDDDEVIAGLIRDTLEPEGYAVAAAGSAAAAREVLGGAPCDLIILDIGLPDGNGFDLCREIRAKSDIPIIFLTGRSDEVDRVLGLEIGGDDYITKPFSPRELLARIRVIEKWIPRDGRRSAAPGGVAGPFRIDERRQAIFYRDAELALTRYEYFILRILVSHPGWTFSREKLMELAWPAPHASDLRTVDAHIKSIRAKLKAVAPQFDPIATKHGFGYFLKDS